jgi:hypothetical protein
MTRQNILITRRQLGAGRAIEREKAETYVPSWPWAPLGFLMKHLPLSIVAMMS